MKNPKETLAKFLYRIGISADLLTVLGLLLALLSGFLVLNESFFWAGAALLLSGFFDLMDGAVARFSGKASAFGGILDSTLDRYGDGFVLGALAILASYQHKVFLACLAMAALLGSFAVSYIRARAECEVDSCRVGFWERGERIVYLALGLLLQNVWTVVLVLALGTQWTAWQRLSFSRDAVLGTPRKKLFSGRREKAYLWKIGILVFLVLFFRL